MLLPVDRSDLPADIARLLGRLRDGLLARGGLAGIYLYGSLATGDFSAARSDIDVVVMVTGEVDRAAVGELRELHAAISRHSVAPASGKRVRGHAPSSVPHKMSRPFGGQ
jgi:predicted nucleotidyltransferase